ncbi:MAG: SpoIIIAH-like family protein [Clostridia bacterium]|nr:SpoIIIAH-like family protein [Clostridia bacterium]
MFTKKKKIIVLTSMVALLVLTGFLNLTLNQQAISTTSTQTVQTSSQSFFEAYRIDRNTAREQQSLYYKAIIESENSTQEAKQEAQTNLNLMASKQEQELVLESYILAKGFNDAVVSFTDNYVNVMVKGAELTEAQVAQIVEVVQQQTSKSIDNIKIIPVE